MAADVQRLLWGKRAAQGDHSAAPATPIASPFPDSAITYLALFL